MASVSLLRAGDPLAQASHQLRVLRAVGRRKPFAASLAESGLDPLFATGIEVLQINLGRLCNMGCRHCHVDAGPERREVMARPTMEACLAVVREAAIPILDLTGGAPEMNPDFRWLVAEARRLGCQVIDRSNLTVLLSPGCEDVPEFLAQQSRGNLVIAYGDETFVFRIDVTRRGTRPGTRVRGDKGNEVCPGAAENDLCLAA